MLQWISLDPISTLLIYLKTTISYQDIFGTGWSDLINRRDGYDPLCICITTT